MPLADRGRLLHEHGGGHRLRVPHVQTAAPLQHDPAVVPRRTEAVATQHGVDGVAGDHQRLVAFEGQSRYAKLVRDVGDGHGVSQHVERADVNAPRPAEQHVRVGAHAAEILVGVVLARIDERAHAVDARPVRMQPRQRRAGARAAAVQVERRSRLDNEVLCAEGARVVRRETDNPFLEPGILRPRELVRAAEDERPVAVLVELGAVRAERSVEGRRLPRRNGDVEITRAAVRDRGTRRRVDDVVARVERERAHIHRALHGHDAARAGEHGRVAGRPRGRAAVPVQG